MVGEVLASLEVRPGGAYIDCTLGEGGHAAAIISAAVPGPRLLGIDPDSEALATARERLKDHGDNVTLTEGSFADLQQLAHRLDFLPADGILFDLGISSLQLEHADRGFSFSQEARLDMRFDRNQQLTAYEVVNRYTERQLADIISRFGEEPHARRLARAILEARPIRTTTELAGVIVRAAGRRGRRAVHPATRTFQALRIAVNRELDNLLAGLEQAVGVLGPRGRLVAISYHSLEDRLVKRTLQREASSCICPPRTPVCVCGHQATIRIVNRRVIKPSAEEVQSNPRSRSARMRVAERL